MSLIFNPYRLELTLSQELFSGDFDFATFFTKFDFFFYFFLMN